MSVVLIRQIPDDYADSTGLSKYGRSRMPGCKDRFQAALNADGRFLTGIDEEAYGIKPDEKEKVKATRLGLEKQTGKDLSGTSLFWQEFTVTIDSDNPKIFNTTNPIDAISLSLLRANKNIAPDKEAAFTPLYKDAQYYAYTTEGEDAEEVSTRKKRDKALGQLLSISEDKDRMLLYGQYLEGIQYSDKLSESTIYKMLRAFIESKEIKNALAFNTIFNKPVEELQQKILIDKALKQRLITKVSQGGKKHVYQYGQVTVGATLEDVYKNLSLPDFAPELMAIKSDLAHK